MTYHRFIRPSFMPVMAECAAAPQVSHAVVEKFGEPPTDAVMDLGTDIHACVMLALIPLTLDPKAEPDIDGALAKFPKLTPWDRACVARCARFAQQLARETCKAFPDDAVELLLEHKLDSSALGFERGGTADMIIVVPFKVVRIVDWKCGFLDQGDAADHDSLATYAVMGASTFHALGVEVFLFQPRADERLRASGARFDGAALRAQLTWTRDIVAAATADNPEARAGLHCTKCRGMHRCAAAKEFFMRVRDILNVIGDPTDEKAWAELAAACKLAGKFSEEAEGMVKAHLTKGNAIPGWCLKPSGTMTKIDAAKAIQLARDAGVLDHLLLHASFKAEAVNAVEAIAKAAEKVDKKPSLSPAKGSAA